MQDNKAEESGVDAQREVTTRRSVMTDRVNVEPPILNGMAASEAKVIAIAAVSFWGSIGLLASMLTHFWPILIISLIVFPIATLWVGSVRLATVKRGRPDGYYGQAIHLWLAKRGLGSRYIRHDGYWDLGTTFDLSLAAPMNLDRVQKELFSKRQSDTCELDGRHAHVAEEDAMRQVHRIPNAMQHQDCGLVEAPNSLNTCAQTVQKPAMTQALHPTPPIVNQAHSRRSDFQSTAVDFVPSLVEVA